MKQTEQTTVTREESPRRGVLSTIVHGVGEVLSWPFRTVGWLVRAIF